MINSSSPGAVRTELYKMDELKKTVNDIGYKNITLIDSNIIINGELLYSASDEVLRRIFYEQTRDKINKGKLDLRREGLFDLHGNKFDIDIEAYKSASFIKRKREPSRKITRSIIDEKNKKHDSIITIPDFIAAETRSKSYKYFQEKNSEYGRWIEQIYYNSPSRFMRMNTGFAETHTKDVFNYENFNRALEKYERERKILESTPLKNEDPADRMLLISGLRLLYETDFGVTIVSDDSKITGRTEAILYDPINYSADGRYLKIQTSSEYAEKLENEDKKMSEMIMKQDSQPIKVF